MSGVALERPTPTTVIVRRFGSGVAGGFSACSGDCIGRVFATAPTTGRLVSAKAHTPAAIIALLFMIRFVLLPVQHIMRCM
jgi:hypothetical protein